jgi:uncharacterized Zn finger protein
MPRRSYDDDWPEYRPRRPADGIKAKNQRGDFGASWWGKRWIGVLESFGYGSRLTRGRTYARGGAVLSIDVRPGQVAAKVQGSRPRPYDVTIGVAQLDDAQWKRAIDAIGEQAIFAAKLLAGEMPQTIEEAFATAKIPLFPRSSTDLSTRCSCPDLANPCKHIAAVHYLLGERFDEDPFLLFELRGRGKAQIVDELRARRAEGAAAGGETAPTPPSEEALPLADLLATFDEPGAELATLAPHIAAPELEAAILRRLGNPPAGVATELRAAYTAITRAALQRLFAEGSDEQGF